MPHVQRWVARLKRLAREMPPEVEVLVMNGTPAVMALHGQGHSFKKDDLSADQDAIIDTVTDGRWDGGDW